MKNRMLKKTIIAGLFSISAHIFGCAAAPVVVVPEVKAEPPAPEPVAKYSTDPNYAPAADRDYRKMTRQKMEDESALNAGAGSLWIMEGQTSYLFAQNKLRRSGDPTKIKVEGSALKQIETKVATIQDLLNELEEQKKQAEADLLKQETDKKKSEETKLRLAEIEKEKVKIIEGNLAGDDAKADAILKMAEDNVNKRMPASEPVLAKKIETLPAAAKKEEKIDLKDVEFIPSRIVEKMADGMYRISGQQTLTIKKRPYKVIATGMIRPEDFDDQGVSSSKIFDPQYDVIHIKKTEKY